MVCHDIEGGQLFAELYLGVFGQHVFLTFDCHFEMDELTLDACHNHGQEAILSDVLDASGNNNRPSNFLGIDISTGLLDGPGHCIAINHSPMVLLQSLHVPADPLVLEYLLDVRDPLELLLGHSIILIQVERFDEDHLVAGEVKRLEVVLESGVIDEVFGVH